MRACRARRQADRRDRPRRSCAVICGRTAASTSPEPDDPTGDELLDRRLERARQLRGQIDAGMRLAGRPPPRRRRSAVTAVQRPDPAVGRQPVEAVGDAARARSACGGRVRTTACDRAQGGAPLAARRAVLGDRVGQRPPHPADVAGRSTRRRRRRGAPAPARSRVKLLFGPLVPARRRRPPRPPPRRRRARPARRCAQSSGKRRAGRPPSTGGPAVTLARAGGSSPSTVAAHSATSSSNSGFQTMSGRPAWRRSAAGGRTAPQGVGDGARRRSSETSRARRAGAGRSSVRGEPQPVQERVHLRHEVERRLGAGRAPAAGRRPRSADCSGHADAIPLLRDRREQVGAGPSSPRYQRFSRSRSVAPGPGGRSAQPLPLGVVQRAARRGSAPSRSRRGPPRA